MNSALLLTAAIACELVATTALKASAGFSRPAPSLVTIVGYALAFYLLALALKRMEIGVAYALWSGVGTAAMALIGAWWFAEPLSPLKLASIGLIVLGVLGLNLAGAAPTQACEPGSSTVRPQASASATVSNQAKGTWLGP